MSKGRPVRAVAPRLVQATGWVRVLLARPAPGEYKRLRCPSTLLLKERCSRNGSRRRDGGPLAAGPFYPCWSSRSWGSPSISAPAPGRDWVNNYAAGVLYELFWCLLLFLFRPRRPVLSGSAELSTKPVEGPAASPSPSSSPLASWNSCSSGTRRRWRRSAGPSWGARRSARPSPGGTFPTTCWAVGWDVPCGLFGRRYDDLSSDADSVCAVSSGHRYSVACRCSRNS